MTPEAGRPRTSTRDLAAVCARFVDWVQPRIASDARPRLTRHDTPAGSGFSSETVVFDLAWEQAGKRSGGAFVMRLPPPPDAFPLFPSYDLARQAAVMRLVGDRTAVPVPEIRWEEGSGLALGCPFFVMERVDGAAAPDLPPYVFDSWLTKATPDQLAEVERSMVRVLAGIHSTSASPEETRFLELDAPGETPLARHFAHQRAYYEWIRALADVPLIDEAFDVLERRMPAGGHAAVVGWGDARLANVLFRDFRPVAVLDWESAAVGPTELDLGWLLYFRDYFQRLAERFGYPGLPTFLTRGRVVDSYADLTGYEPRDLDWYLDYAALRQALVSIRVSLRAIAFGERERPADPNDLVMDRQYLSERLGR